MVEMLHGLTLAKTGLTLARTGLKPRSGWAPLVGVSSEVICRCDVLIPTLALQRLTIGLRTAKNPLNLAQNC